MEHGDDVLTFMVSIRPRDFCRLSDSIDIVERVSRCLRDMDDSSFFIRHQADQLDAVVIRLKSLRADFKHCAGDKDQLGAGI